MGEIKDPPQFSVYPIYWCGICSGYTVHSLMYQVGTLPRALAKCQACSRTHTVKLDEAIEE